MKAFKIIGIVCLVLLGLFMFLCTVYFLFANHNYGIDVFRQLFTDNAEGSVFAGIKNFFVEIWKGIKFAFEQ